MEPNHRRLGIVRLENEGESVASGAAVFLDFCREKNPSFRGNDAAHSNAKD